MPDLIYRKEFSVHTYESDVQGLARPVALLNFLQDAAGDHASLLGWSVTDLWKKNMTWVLSRTHILVHRYPAWGERIEVLTWPSGRHGYFALRDFEVTNGCEHRASPSAWFERGSRRFDGNIETLCPQAALSHMGDAMTNGDEWSDPVFSQPAAAPSRASATRLVALGLVAASTVLAAALVTVLHRPAPREDQLPPSSAQVTAAPALRPPPPASPPAVRATVTERSRRRAPDILEGRR